MAYACGRAARCESTATPRLANSARIMRGHDDSELSACSSDAVEKSALDMRGTAARQRSCFGPRSRSCRAIGGILWLNPSLADRSLHHLRLARENITTIFLQSPRARCQLLSCCSRLRAFPKAGAACTRSRAIAGTSWCRRFRRQPQEQNFLGQVSFSEGSSTRVQPSVHAKKRSISSMCTPYSERNFVAFHGRTLAPSSQEEVAERSSRGQRYSAVALSRSCLPLRMNTKYSPYIAWVIPGLP